MIQFFPKIMHLLYFYKNTNLYHILSTYLTQNFKIYFYKYRKYCKLNKNVIPYNKIYSK